MRTNIIQFSRKYHRLLLWPAYAAALVFIISAICHPLMIWTGPQPVKRLPPSLEINAQDLAQTKKTLASIHSSEVSIAQIIPSKEGMKLQLTKTLEEPREYFSHNSALPLPNYDHIHAQWLARYYTGQTAPIRSITFITKFSTDYPEVNRLLPVYKVIFNTEDQLTAYIHTETNALAALTNNWKQSLKTLFQLLHTFNWLDDFPVVRLILMSTLLSILSIMLLSGAYLLLSLKRKQYKRRLQYLHRKLAWAVFIPFAGFLFSGFYHLYQQALKSPTQTQLSLQSIDLSSYQSVRWPEAIDGRPITALSLITIDQQPAIRASLANNKNSRDTSREKHFTGLPKEQSGIYFSTDGNLLALNDGEYAKQLLSKFMNIQEVHSNNPKKITRFGNGYDFRNKRLPVWRVDLSNGETVFIDPRTAMLVEKVTKAQKLEGWIFSMLHKWNFLKGSLGRAGRDTALVLILLLMMSLTIIGQQMGKRLKVDL
jgi:hypothetical protein